mmetsp:Transcript_13562/g.24497  ORF Transcript_13562/g.24497 Transcript_13562/m.24497 type:complete len:110 (-) Transcript_13562:707-1036(-)
MGRGASMQRVPWLVLVVDDAVNELVRVDVDLSWLVSVVDDGANELFKVDVDVVVDASSSEVVDAIVDVTLMSAQFQNFSAPLLLVLGSTTAEGHEDNNGFHHALASPPV